MAAIHTYDVRGRKLPGMDQWFPLGDGRLGTLVIEGGAVNLGVDDFVYVRGDVPDDEVWRIINMRVYDRGTAGVPVKFGSLSVGVKLGEYQIDIEAGAPNTGSYVPEDDRNHIVWTRVTKAGGSGVQWWRSTDGSYGQDVRWMRPRDSKLAWIEEAGYSNQEWQDPNNINLGLWPPGAQWLTLSQAAKTAHAVYRQRVYLNILRMKTSDLRKWSPLLVEGLP